MLFDRLSYLVVCVSVLLMIGCSDADRRPFAGGKEGVIYVVADSNTWDGPVGQAIRDELAQPIETLPIPEPMFTLQRLNLNSSLLQNVIQKQKYLLFAGSLNEPTNVGRFIRSSLDSSLVVKIQNGDTGVLQRNDLWYRNQLVVFATAEDANALAGQIYDNGPNLRYVFNKATRERLTEFMFRRQRQEEIESDLMQEHDFAVNAQYDYFVAQDTMNFIRLRRVLTDTWREVFIYYIENGNPADITPSWIISTRDSLTEKFVRGTFDGSYVKVDGRRPLTSDNINFLGRFGYETRTLWHMTEDAMGGPLVNYTFYDEDQQRIYMIDGMVFAPNYDKREFLRQVEAIAYTFRTRDEVASSAQTAGR